MDNVPDNTSVQEAWRRQVLRLLQGLRLQSRISTVGVMLMWGGVFMAPLLMVHSWILYPALFALMAAVLAVILAVIVHAVYGTPRCPACHRAIIQFAWRYCPSCGVRLAPPLKEPDPVVREAWQKRRRRRNVGIGLNVAVLTLLAPFTLCMIFYIFPPTQYGWYSLLAGLPPLAAICLISILCPEARCPVCAEVNECGGHCLNCDTLLAPEPAKMPADDLSAAQVHTACEDALRRQRTVCFFLAPTLVPPFVIVVLTIAKIIPDDWGLLIVPAAIPMVVALVICHRKGYTTLRCPVCNDRVQAGRKYHAFCPTCGTQLKDTPTAKRKAS